ncbi:hypothetical protein [Streptomyces coffeae]|uniref:Uncharacterized protein n=1 Tax=Streptomyces coffeae TaxID=621382 RepID=A0ABS1N8R9_9ACTN|nr:hypothetical protein [Streptomyces coffeae]MBL1096352.1 hypothetical protein [Streptomyces coffeae]
MHELYAQEWFARIALPLAACALVTWISLIHRFADKGRLLGTARSTALCVAITGCTCAAALITITLLLPHAADVPPAVAAAAAGGALAPRVRQQQNQQSTPPFVAVITLGIAVLLDRLERRLAHDMYCHCHRLVRDFGTVAQLRMFAFDSRGYLRGSTPVTKERTAINTLYEEVDQYLDDAAKVEADIEASCRQRELQDFPVELHSATREEAEDRRQALAMAKEACVKMLEFGYRTGKRSADRDLERLRDQALTEEPLAAAGASHP